MFSILSSSLLSAGFFFFLPLTRTPGGLYVWHAGASLTHQMIASLCWCVNFSQVRVLATLDPCAGKGEAPLDSSLCFFVSIPQQCHSSQMKDTKIVFRRKRAQWDDCSVSREILISKLWWLERGQVVQCVAFNLRTARASDCDTGEKMNCSREQKQRPPFYSFEPFKFTRIYDNDFFFSLSHVRWINLPPHGEAVLLIDHRSKQINCSAWESMYTMRGVIIKANSSPLITHQVHQYFSPSIVQRIELATVSLQSDLERQFN